MAVEKKNDVMSRHSVGFETYRNRAFHNMSLCGLAALVTLVATDDINHHFNDASSLCAHIQLGFDNGVFGILYLIFAFCVAGS